MSRRRQFTHLNFPIKGERFRDIVNEKWAFKIRNTTYKKDDTFLAQDGHIYTILEIIEENNIIYFRAKDRLLFPTIVMIRESDVVMKVNPNDNIDVEKQVRRFLTKKTGIMPRVAATKAQVSKLTQLEEKINKEIKAIRVQGLLKKRKESLEDFLKNFFTKWNEERDTILVDNKDVDTEAGCRRSLGDVYKIAKYYYPKCTLKEVKDILYTFAENESKLKGFRSSYCHSTKKRMFYYSSDAKNGILNGDENDEFGMKVEAWKNL